MNDQTIEGTLRRLQSAARAQHFRRVAIHLKPLLRPFEYGTGAPSFPEAEMRIVEKFWRILFDIHFNVPEAIRLRATKAILELLGAEADPVPKLADGTVAAISHCRSIVEVCDTLISELAKKEQTESKLHESRLRLVVG